MMRAARRSRGQSGFPRRCRHVRLSPSSLPCALISPQRTMRALTPTLSPSSSSLALYAPLFLLCCRVAECVRRARCMCFGSQWGSRHGRRASRCSAAARSSTFARRTCTSPRVCLLLPRVSCAQRVPSVVGGARRGGACESGADAVRVSSRVRVGLPLSARGACAAAAARHTAYVCSASCPVLE